MYRTRIFRNNALKGACCIEEVVAKLEGDTQFDRPKVWNLLRLLGMYVHSQDPKRPLMNVKRQCFLERRGSRRA
jgi:hypothetical protein